MRELHFLNLLRGVSAVLVMFTHVRGYLFVHFENIVNPTFFQKVFYFITGLGHQAVIVFFVLSGFLVGGSFFKSSYTLSSYFVNRVSRLWTVLIPALIITFVVDFYFYDPTSGSNTRSMHSGEYSLGVDVFLGNIFFLQTIYFPTYGTNDPMWSLANEFWYYVLFPLIFIMFNKLRNRKIDLYTLVFLIIILLWLPSNITLLFPVWLIGFLVYLFYEKFRANGYFFLISLFSFFLTLAAARYKLINGIGADYLVGVSIAVLILTSPVVEKNFNRCDRCKAFLSWLSSISYSLYLFHFPLLVFFVSVSDTLRKNPDYYVLMQFFLLSLGIVLVSWVLWFLFEKHTFKVRKIMTKIFA